MFKSALIFAYFGSLLAAETKGTSCAASGPEVGKSGTHLLQTSSKRLKDQCLRKMGEAPLPDHLVGFDMKHEFGTMASNNPQMNIVRDEYGAIVKLVKHLAEKHAGPLNLLDIGGNSGKDYEMQIRRYTNYTSLDFKPSDAAGIDHMGQPIAQSLVGNIVRCNAHLEGSKFDVVMALNMFEHIAAPAQAASEMIRLVKNGGYLIVSNPFSWRYHAYPLDMLRYTHTGLRFFFESTGDVSTMHTSYTKYGPTEHGHYLDKSDEPPDGAFQDPTDVMWIGRRIDGTVFNPDSLDHNAAFGPHVEGLPEPIMVSRCTVGLDCL